MSTTLETIEIPAAPGHTRLRVQCKVGLRGRRTEPVCDLYDLLQYMVERLRGNREHRDVGEYLDVGLEADGLPPGRYIGVPLTLIGLQKLPTTLLRRLAWEVLDRQQKPRGVAWVTARNWLMSEENYAWGDGMRARLRKMLPQEQYPRRNADIIARWKKGHSPAKICQDTRQRYPGLTKGAAKQVINRAKKKGVRRRPPGAQPSGLLRRK
jgi:hypothetical protein